MEQEEQEPVEQQKPETDRKQEPAVALRKTETAQGDAQSKAEKKQQRPQRPRISCTSK